MKGGANKKHVEIDWQKPVQEVWNLIRGADPQPGAWSTYKGQVVQIYDAKKLPGAAAGAPGEVVAVAAESFTVATQGGQIEVRRVRPADGGKMRAADFVKSSWTTPRRPARQLNVRMIDCAGPVHFV